MRQREVYQVDSGSDFTRQPVVIVSGNTMNQFSDSVIVCPLISPPKKYPGGVIVKRTPQNGLSADAEILPFYIRSIQKDYLKKPLGTVEAEEFHLLLSNLWEVLLY